MIQTFGRKNVGTKYSIDNVHEVKVYTVAILKQFTFLKKTNRTSYCLYQCNGLRTLCGDLVQCRKMGAFTLPREPQFCRFKANYLKIYL